jgi:hypothetical protein
VGAVADSIVVVGGAFVEEGASGVCPNIFDRRLVNIPIGAQTTLRRKKLPAASQFAEIGRPW